MAVNNVKNSGAGAPPTPLASANDASKTSKVAAKQAQGAYAQAAAPSTRDAANVQISSRAKEMSMARRIAEETPDVREDKVAKFKSLIESGQYRPDAGRIADAIAAEAIKDELSKSPDVALD